MISRAMSVCVTASLFIAGALTSAESATAQCATCVQPTIAYSPVVAQPVAPPTVYQTYRAYDGWYPGKWIGRTLFGRRATTTLAVAPAPSSAYVTSAYRPTYPMTYVAGYAAPTTQTVGYSAPSCNACTTYRPVTLTAMPICSPCGGCDACSACGGTQNIGYTVSAGTSCSNCAGAPATYESPSSYTLPATGPATRTSPEPTPAIDPNTYVPEERSTLKKPVVEPASGGADGDIQDESTSYFTAPQLYNPRDQTTRRPTVPVRTAVYRKTSGGQDPGAWNVARSASAPAPRNQQAGVSGWRSASP